jgi:hypothetical protein
MGFAPTPAPEALYWKLRLNENAIQLSTVAPYDTFRLIATALTPSGEEWQPVGMSDEEAAELLTESPVRFRSTDSTKVGVTADGLVKAIGATPGVVRVIASRRIGKVTRSDEVQVRVVATPAEPPVLTTFGIQHVGDSNRVASEQVASIRPTVLDANDQPIAGVVVYYTSSDTNIAKVSSPWSSAATVAVTGRKMGKALITARTWVYGVAKVDTLTLSVGYPVLKTAMIDKRTKPDGSLEFYLGTTVANIGPGGTVTWDNSTGGLGQKGAELDIVFDDPTHVLPPSPAVAPDITGGNILGIPSDTTLLATDRMRRRRFVEPGTYHYKILPIGLSGTVVVHPNN